VRYLVALTLLFFATSCSPREDNVAGNNVDISAAAKEAQGSIDAYAKTTQNLVAPMPAPEPAPGAASTPSPRTRP
jgi:hypothetical protein